MHTFLSGNSFLLSTSPNVYTFLQFSSVNSPHLFLEPVPDDQFRNEMDSQAFHYFPLLPLELRLKIWPLLLPDPRIVDIIAVSKGGDHQFFQEKGRRIQSFVDCLQSPGQEVCGNVLMFVNREARNLLLKRWKVMQEVEVIKRGVGTWERARYKEEVGEGEVGKAGGRQIGPEVQQDGKESVFYLHPPAHRASPILFNPDQDVLFLADPSNTSQSSSLAILVRWLEKELVKSVRYLAVPYNSWRKDRLYGNLGELKKFKALERLWICFVADENFQGTGDWLAAVRRRGRDESQGGRDIKEENKYLVEIREQVRGDVASDGALLGWERPVVRVVRDRGVVMKELREIGEDGLSDESEP
jgi:hypothetical protein